MWWGESLNLFPPNSVEDGATPTLQGQEQRQWSSNSALALLSCFCTEIGVSGSCSTALDGNIYSIRRKGIPAFLGFKKCVLWSKKSGTLISAPIDHPLQAAGGVDQHIQGVDQLKGVHSSYHHTLPIHINSLAAEVYCKVFVIVLIQAKSYCPPGCYRLIIPAPT